MTPRDAECIEALSAARGDERDDPRARRHLDACASCRSEIADVRVLARIAREALARAAARPDAAHLAEESLERARRNGPVILGVPSVALAALAAVFFLAVTLTLLGGPGAGSPSSPRTRDAAARSVPPAGPFTPRAASAPSAMVLELEHPTGRRLPWVLHGPQGIERGELDLTTDYVLDTVPANAVVVDTF